MSRANVPLSRAGLSLQIIRTTSVLVILGVLVASGIVHSSAKMVNHTSMTNASAQTSASDSGPDLILTNGDIYTGEASRPRVQALAARDEVIIARGGAEIAEKISSSMTYTLTSSVASACCRICALSNIASSLRALRLCGES